jgi:hypothetical protein
MVSRNKSRSLASRDLQYSLHDTAPFLRFNQLNNFVVGQRDLSVDGGNPGEKQRRNGILNRPIGECKEKSGLGP